MIRPVARPHRYTNCIDCTVEIEPSEVQPRCKHCAGLREVSGFAFSLDGKRGGRTLDMQEGNWEEWH